MHGIFNKFYKCLKHVSYHNKLTGVGSGCNVNGGVLALPRDASGEAPLSPG